MVKQMNPNDNQNNRLDAFLLEYFKYLREEINLRIIKHSDLVLYKLISLGAILAFILGSFKSPNELIDLTKNSLILIWIVPLIGATFDMIILGNLRVVANIGLYLMQNYEEKILDKLKKEDKSYLFSWDKIPGNDNVRLIEFLTQKFGIDWVKTAKIEKNDDSKTIKVTSGKNFLSLRLNDEKNYVNLEIDDVRTDEFIVMMENGELNIYDKSLESFEFWESSGAHDKLMWKCYTRFDMTIICSITYFLVLLPLIATFYFYYESPLNIYYALNIVLGILIAFISLKIYTDMCNLVAGKSWFGSFLNFMDYRLHKLIFLLFQFLKFR